MTKNMEKTTKELTIKDYTLQLNSLIVSFVREYINRIKEIYRIEDGVICDIIGLDEESYAQLMDDKFNGNISSGLIATIYIITGGKFSLSHIANSFEFDELIFNKEIDKIFKKRYQKKVEKLLEYLHIDTEESLDEFIKNFEEIKNVYNDKEELLSWLRNE